MDLGLMGQQVVVVGAARGLGYAIAAEFAREGARVALLDVSADVYASAARLGAAASGPAAENGAERITGHVVDVVDYSAVRATADAIRSRAGRVDHVAFAAGIGSGKFGFPFWQLDPSDWPRVLEVNLIGAVNVAHAFAPQMAAAGVGTFVFLASVAGQIGSQTDPPYSASKAGLINFSQCAAKDLAPFGVRVNCLCPGMVKTPLNRSVWQAWVDRQPPDARREYDDWAAEKIAKLVPLNRWQEPEDVAAMAVFLASARAANVTGQTVNVDGGYVIR